MPHIDLGNDQPGIRSLFFYRPETAAPLCELVEVLLRGPSTLERWERELIATHVSGLNECRYCATTHGAFTTAQLPAGLSLDVIRADLGAAPISEKLKALLAVAGAVQESGKAVTAELVDAARVAGATDAELHDTVLIAAAFCMYNRYVDGLATWAPTDPNLYRENGRRLAEEGYVASTERLPGNRAR